MKIDATGQRFAYSMRKFPFLARLMKIKYVRMEMCLKITS
jgi:hypothetical protein